MAEHVGHHWSRTVVDGRPVESWCHGAYRIPAEVILVEVCVSLLTGVGGFGNRLRFGAALLAVKVIIVEIVVRAEGRHVLPHHVSGGPGRPVHVHDGATVKEVVVVRDGHDRRRRHAEQHHNNLGKRQAFDKIGTRKKIRTGIKIISAMITRMKKLLLLLLLLPPLMIMRIVKIIIDAI